MESVADDGSILEGEAPAIPLPTGSLKSRTLKGVAWTLAGDGGFLAIRMISNLVLARLLLPQEFGVMSIVTVVQTGLAMFSDVGIQPAIVQHRRGDDPVFLNTAWTTQAIRGACLWMTTAVLAWPVSLYCNETLLLYLLPVTGLNSLIEGFLSTKVFTCDRHLSLGRLTFLNLGSAIFGLAVRIVWAFYSPTVWSLVAGGLLTTLPRVILSHWIIRGPVNRFAWDRRSMHELVHFGRWIFLSTILTFFASKVHELVFVKMIPMAMLGIYYHGSTFCRVPVETFQKVGTNVAFPALSRLGERQGDLQSAYARMRAPLLAAGGTVMGMLALGAPLMILILLPSNYQAAGWIIQIVALGLWFQMIQATNQMILLAQAQPKWLALGNAIKICSMAVIVPITYHYWDFVGALAGMSLSEIPKYVFEAYRVRRMGLKGWGIELGMTAAVFGCGAVALAIRLGGAGEWIRLSALTACFLFVWAPLLLWARRVSRVF